MRCGIPLPYFSQTHVCLISAWSDGPDQADSLSSTYASRVSHGAHAACSCGTCIWPLDSCHLCWQQNIAATPREHFKKQKANRSVRDPPPLPTACGPSRPPKRGCGPAPPRLMGLIQAPPSECTSAVPVCFRDVLHCLVALQAAASWRVWGAAVGGVPGCNGAGLTLPHGCHTGHGFLLNLLLGLVPIPRHQLCHSARHLPWAKYQIPLGRRGACKVCGAAELPIGNAINRNTHSQWKWAEYDLVVPGCNGTAAECSGTERGAMDCVSGVSCECNSPPKLMDLYCQ